MKGRKLSAAERRQRQSAALKSGAHSATKTRPTATRLYGRLRRRLVRAEGPTTPATRLRLRLLATTLARVDRAEAWLAEQDDELFEDVSAGTLHALHDRLDRWVNTASALIDKLPEGSRDALGADLRSLAGSPRR